MSIPGFAAELSFYKTSGQHRMDVTTEQAVVGVIPQYCRCFAVPTLYADPLLGPRSGPPYHYYCYGSDCWRPKFGVNPILG